MSDDRGTTGPQIDGRRRDQFVETVEEMLPYYVEEWEAEEGDMGATLLLLFAELAEEVTERLDRLPEKHHIAFYDRLGFDREPPQPARAPLAVDVADRAGENVTVPAGTVATAEAADGSEQPFEVPEGDTFDATPANLEAAFSVDGSRDAIYAHHDAIGGGVEESLFAPESAENLQQHALYIGDEDGLTVGSGSALTVELESDADPELFQGLDWQYYGEITEDEETIEDWHDFDGITASRSGSTVELKLTFAPDSEATVTEYTVSDIENRWIRCRIPDAVGGGELTELFDLRVGNPGSGTAPIKVGASHASGLQPDLLLHNDVPLPTTSFAQTGSLVLSKMQVLDIELDAEVIAQLPESQVKQSDQTIFPFGHRPRQQDSFYLSSADALTKSGGEVVFEFQSLSSGSGSPVLSWEYYDGDGWSKIQGLEDTTKGFLVQGQDNTVTFDVPRDLAETTVAGHEGHWIRVRLVSGDYGELEFEPVYNSSSEFPVRYEPKTTRIDPPSFSGVTITYEDTEPPEYVVTENNLGFDADRPVEAGSYQPFEGVPVTGQSLYAGFDAPLEDGPINLLFDLADIAYRQSFTPQVRWEYYYDGTWTRPTVRDGTEGLTERGIVGLTVPETTAPTSQLGRDLHWVRARVSAEQFERESETRLLQLLQSSDREPQPCDRTVETVPPAGDPAQTPPSLRGIYTNATWARNRETIGREVLGSSDGSVSQSFSAANTPVVDATVWVDELAVLSEGEREKLAEQLPDRTSSETDATGDTTAFWVQWEHQSDLLDSGADERHYTLDPIAGTVSFGDGTRGEIPPRGTDNVRMSYTTGGGAAGNLPAGAVSKFRQSLAFVESVTNPLPGGAGADAESTAAVVDRAARQLRDRDRAVAPVDYERIATDASRQLARAKCLPAMNQSGDYQPGWVTLLIVPDSPAPKPKPSETLRQDVEQAIAEKAPATPVGLDQIVVRAPSYVMVTVDVEVAAAGGSIAQLEEDVHETVGGYLHPLTGGSDGAGWQFGVLPCRSDFFELLEGVEQVDHVVELAVTFETSRSTVTVDEGEPTPDTAPDALVYSGEHTVKGSLAGGGRQ